MNAPRLSVVATLLAIALCSGCETSRNARIQENPALFASLDRFSQELVRKGLFNYGFSSEVVYMALGKPNRVTVKESDDGKVETWVYRNFLYEAGTAVTVGVSTPGTRPMGTVLSSSAPGGPSLMSTKSGPGQAAITEDSALCTLFIDLVENRVVGVRILR